jgi:hypothetical protein
MSANFNRAQQSKLQPRTAEIVGSHKGNRKSLSGYIPRSLLRGFFICLPLSPISRFAYQPKLPTTGISNKGRALAG